MYVSWKNQYIKISSKQLENVLLKEINVLSFMYVYKIKQFQKEIISICTKNNKYPHFHYPA